MAAKLCVRHLPAEQADSQQHIVLLHGWGIDSAVWSALVPLLRKHAAISLVDLPGFGGSEKQLPDSVDEWLAGILAAAPVQAIYCGFSLGGMLAVQLAQRFPERVSAVITIASNARFVASENWPEAMAEDSFDSFSQLLEKNPAAARKRFAALQALGTDGERETVKTLKKLGAETRASDRALATALQVLAALDNRKALATQACPSLYVFGSRDQLVPVVAAQAIDNLSAASVAVIDGAAHVPLISHSEQCYTLVRDFLVAEKLIARGEQARQLDKRQVARSFSRAAKSYDSVAVLQRRVGENLLARVPGHSAPVVVDLGCGSGFFLPALATRLGGEVIAFDLAEGMTAYVKQREASRCCVCGDAEAMPLADSSVDIIFSSLAVQWCEDKHALFSEVRRVLKPGGKMFFSTLGPETLFELKQAWSAVDDYVHVNRFIERAALQQAVTDAGFAGVAIDEEMIGLEYPQLNQLTRELKGIGAHNMNEGRPAGLTGRQRIKQLLAAYESQRNERGMLPATYQVWYGVLEK